MAAAIVPALEHPSARTIQRPATPLHWARGWLQDWPWLLALSLLTLLFFLTFFNRFVGMRSGTGEFTTGIWFLQGRLPYRDYFSATPPLNTLKSALLLHLFGPYLIVSRAAGVAERVAIACLLFRWLCRLFPARFAFAASLVTIIVSAGDRTDPIASYNHDAIIWAMLSGFAASHVLSDLRTRSFYIGSAAAGIFAGLCMLTKQTIGLGATIAVPTAVAILLLNSGLRTRALTWLAAFAAGWTIPILAFVLWLQRLHMLGTFVTMVFLKGPAAKGAHPGDFLRRELMVAHSNWFFVALALIGIGLTVRAIIRSQGRSTHSDSSSPNPCSGLARLSFGFGLVILSAELLAFSHLAVFYNCSKAAVYLVLLVVAAQVLIYAAISLRKRLTERQSQFALFATVSFFVAFFLSLSWPAFEAMTLPGLGFLVAAILDGTAPRSRRYVYLALSSLVFLQVREKLAMPFAFEGLSEQPVIQAVEPSMLPELRGMRLPPATNRFLEGTVASIAAHSTPADTILAYPEISLFYPLSGRGYPTQASSHNVDVVNDAFASEEAVRILARQPAIVIYMKHTPEEVRHEDEIWRFGKPSGQHKLVKAVEQLTSGYILSHAYLVGQESRPIQVFLRPDTGWHPPHQ